MDPHNPLDCPQPLTMITQVFSAALVALVASSPAYAWWRVACTTPLVTERIDPIISPNVIGSQHTHVRSPFSTNHLKDSQANPALVFRRPSTVAKV